PRKHMKYWKALGAIMLALFVSPADDVKAATIVVTPDDIGLPGWFEVPVGTGTTEITTNYPRSGNGSYQQTVSGTGSSSDEANSVLFWNPNDASNPFGTTTYLSELNSLSYEWIRNSSSTNPG